MQRLVLLALVAVAKDVLSGSPQDPGMQQKTATVTFNNGVIGGIDLVQADYKSPLEMKVNLKGLKDTVGPWHIHRLPVVSDCSANSTSGHYNPMNVSATYKACESPEDCEAGDLSTKYGALVAGDVQRDIVDPKLSLFGFNSIVGRSVVLHNQDGTRFACGTIKYEGVAVTSAKAAFGKDGPYVGQAVFAQPTGNNLADTAIFMDLKLADGTAAPAAPVVWAVYDQPCGTEGAKPLNPGDLGACKQFENTSPFKPCALGDLSGRHGKISLPATGAGALFVNDYLPLSGDDSIIGKSLVLEASGTTPAACANIDAVASAAPLSRRRLLRTAPQ